MDNDQDEHRRKAVAGSVKELIGKLIGDKEIEDEGAREKAGIGVPKAPDSDQTD